MPTPKAKFEISARDKSKAALGSAKKNLKAFTGEIFSLKSAVVSLVGAAGLGLLVKRSFESGDALAKTADKLGITTAKLAGLQHAAELTGVAQETLTKALTKQQKAIFDADRGLLTYKQHFDALGLSVSSLKQQSPDAQFRTIADALNKLENQTQKTAIAYDLFGGRGTALLNTIALGADGLNAAAIEAEALGLAVSRVDAAKIEQANDTFTRAKGVLKGVGNAIAANVAPFITALGTQFVNAAKEAGGMANFVGRAMNTVIDAVGFAADVVRGLQVVWKGVQVIALGAISAILTGLDEVNKAGAAALNWIPGLDIKPSAALSDWANESREVLIMTIDEMDRLAMLPMPSNNVKRWATEIQHQAQVAAEAIAKTKKAMVVDSGGQGEAPAAASDKAEQKEKAALGRSIDALQQSLLTKEQREAESLERRSFMVEEAFQNQVINEEYRNELLAGLAAKHEDQKTAIAAKGEADRRRVMAAGLGAASNIFSGLSSLMAREGKKQSATQKLLARASIITSTAQAIMNALAVSPYPLGLALAAGAALEGAKQLRAVGGGGGVSAPVASTVNQERQSLSIPSSQPQQTEPQTNNQTIIIIGANGRSTEYDPEGVIGVIDDAVNTGGQVVIRPDTPQMDLIAEAVARINA